MPHEYFVFLKVFLDVSTFEILVVAFSKILPPLHEEISVQITNRDIILKNFVVFIFLAFYKNNNVY